MTKRLILVLLALAVLARSPAPATPSATPSATPISTLAPGEIALQTVQPHLLPSGVVEACAGLGLSAVLRGDPRDPRIAWFVANPGGRRDVIWPAGYRARFVPTLEILDGAGHVMLREGDPVTGGCVTGDANVLQLQPPFK